MADTKDETQAPETTEAAAEDAQPEVEAPKPTGPFELLPGALIEYGTRKGKVFEVRGNGEAPYDVGVRWDDSKYPEWHQYTALNQAWAEGSLRVTRQGRWSLLRKLMASM